MAASTGLTGAAAKGGNWELEYATGMRTAAGLRDDAYQGVLLSATFDFEPGTGTITGLDSFDGTFFGSQTNNAAGETLNIQSFGDGMSSAKLWGVPPLAGTDSLISGFSTGVTAIQFSLASGRRFDLTSLLARDDFHGNGATTVVITSDKGAAFFSITADGNVVTFDVAASPWAANMKGIAWFQVSSSEPDFWYTFDNISLANIGLPTITGISPTSGSTTGGTAVTISGTNFTDATAVTIGDAAATDVSVVNATTITATTSAGSAGVVDVAVTTPGGTGTGTGLFTYFTPVAVTSVSPGSGPSTGGTTVTITGTGFTGTTGVTIGGAPATSVTVSNDTSITAVTPSGTAGAQDVVVSRTHGSGTGTGLFTYVAAPAVSAVSPSSGAVAGGTSVTITGSNFSGASAVNFGANAATSYTVDTPTQITAIAPAGASGIVDITVTTIGGTSATSARDGFNYITGPIVTSILADSTTSPSTVYAGIYTQGVYVSTDNTNWNAANGTAPHNLANLYVMALARSSTGTLFAATYGGGVFKTLDGGANWSACDSATLSNQNVISLVIDGNGELYAGTEVGVFVSGDACASWTASNNGLPY